MGDRYGDLVEEKMTVAFHEECYCLSDESQCFIFYQCEEGQRCGCYHDLHFEGYSLLYKLDRLSSCRMDQDEDSIQQ